MVAAFCNTVATTNSYRDSYVYPDSYRDTGVYTDANPGWHKLGFSQGGGQLALWIVVFYTVARHVEDYLVVPNVVGRAVHLHPIITLFAVLAGGALAGVLGMVLAVPTAAALVAVWDVVRRAGTEEAPAHLSQTVARSRTRDAEG